MKKLSLLLSAFALVMGLSQCRKPNMLVLNAGETQHVVLNASWDNGGSKLEQVGAGLKWKEGDKLYVNQGDESIGTLICKDPDNGTFEGYINETTGNITFTFHGANYKEDFKEQTGKLNDAVLLKSEELEYRSDGDYGTVLMNMPHAVLKLDVSALGTTGAMTIAANGATVASVTDVSGIASAVFVAVPTDEIEKAYTITCNGKTATKTWTLEKNVFYTKAGAEGAGIGDAIVIEPDAPATPKFSVGENTTVEFAPGNLYYNGKDDDHKMNSNLPSGWNFYEHQWNCYPSGTSSVTESMEISLFTWGYGTWSKVYNTTTYQTGSGVTMTDWGSLAIGGYEADTWRTLTRDEWNYLLGFDPEQWAQTDDYGRPGAKNLCAWKELDGGAHNGLVILPDGTDALVMSSITSTEALATHGAVFLPAAGFRNGTDVNFVGLFGSFWSGTPLGGTEDSAYFMLSNSGFVNVSSDLRNYGYAVRLVR